METSRFLVHIESFVLATFLVVALMPFNAAVRSRL